MRLSVGKGRGSEGEHMTGAFVFSPVLIGLPRDTVSTILREEIRNSGAPQKCLTCVSAAANCGVVWREWPCAERVFCEPCAYKVKAVMVRM